MHTQRTRTSKQSLLRIACLLLLLFPGYLWPAIAQPYSDTTEEVVRQYAQRLFPDRESIVLTKTNLPIGTPASVFNIGNQEGFVLVSDFPNQPQQILGYSPKGRFDYEQAPDALKVFLSILSDQANDRPMNGRSYTAVGPILSSQWGQNEPFNLLSPTINGTLSPAGCGATSMSQVLNHYQFPDKGNGQIEYFSTNCQTQFSVSLDTIPLDWDNMLDIYNEETGYNETEAQAVANLMYACGMGMQMNYGISGSSAYTDKLEFGLRRYFGYNAFSRYQDLHEVSPEDWHAYIAKDMEDGYPIIYIADINGHGGHIFLLDGMDAEGLIHINWGWAGYADGYYALGFFNPQARGYNDNAIMISRIHPKEEEEPNENLLTWSSQPFSYIGDNTKAAYSAAHLYTAADLLPHVGKRIEAIEFLPGERECTYNLSIWGDPQRQELLFDQEVTAFKAGDPIRVELSEPFPIPPGRDLYIGYSATAAKGYPIGVDVGPMVAGKGDLLVINPTEGDAFSSFNGKDTQMDFNIFLRIYVDEATSTEMIEPDYTITPNPTTDHITITHPLTSGRPLTFSLFDSSGSMIRQKQSSSSKTTIDLSDLPKGVYILHDGNRSEKVVKQ